MFQAAVCLIERIEPRHDAGGRHSPEGESSKKNRSKPLIFRGTPKSTSNQSPRLPLDQHVQRFSGTNGAESGFSTRSSANVNDAEAAISCRTAPS